MGIKALDCHRFEQPQHPSQDLEEGPPVNVASGAWEFCRQILADRLDLPEVKLEFTLHTPPVGSEDREVCKWRVSLFKQGIDGPDLVGSGLANLGLVCPHGTVVFRVQGINLIVREKEDVGVVALV